MDNTKDEYLERLKRGESIVIPLHEERITVRKERKVVEEIIIRREKYVEIETIRVPVKREIVTVDEIEID